MSISNSNTNQRDKPVIEEPNNKRPATTSNNVKTNNVKTNNIINDHHQIIIDCKYKNAYTNTTETLVNKYKMYALTLNELKLTKNKLVNNIKNISHNLNIRSNELVSFVNESTIDNLNNQIDNIYNHSLELSAIMQEIEKTENILKDLKEINNSASK
jgi:hypothetical protein